MDVQLLEKLYAVTRIPYQLYDQNVCTHRSPGFEPSPASLIIRSAASSSHASCYTTAYEHQHYGMVRIGEPESMRFILVGPAISVDCSFAMARKTLRDLHQPESRVNELVLWLGSTPLCDLERLKALLCYLDYLINGVDGRAPIHIPYLSKEPVPPIEQPLPFFYETHSDELEKQLVSCVEYGRPELLEHTFRLLETETGAVPPVAANELRAMKNIMMFSLGVVSRAALKGGMDYDSVNTLTGRYLEQVEVQKRQGSLEVTFRQMMVDFARRTARARLSLSSTAVVQKVSQYAIGHLYEKVTPTLIAKSLGMNVSYLCTHFRKETGKTIATYVNEIKINECKRLLRSTNLPIAQIAAQLSYSSQSYLIKVFKNLTGQTPSEYRNRAT